LVASLSDICRIYYPKLHKYHYLPLFNLKCCLLQRKALCNPKVRTFPGTPFNLLGNRLRYTAAKYIKGFVFQHNSEVYKFINAAADLFDWFICWDLQVEQPWSRLEAFVIQTKLNCCKMYIAENHLPLMHWTTLTGQHFFLLLSVLSGPLRYDCVGPEQSPDPSLLNEDLALTCPLQGRWIYQRDGRELMTQLDQELKMVFKVSPHLSGQK